MKLISKKIIPYKGKVYDLQIKSKDHSYNIEGVVVHNSAAGALLSYSLNITTIDPLQFGLYFERFMNPERNAAPDIDFDVMQGSRELIRGYLEDKYGKESVFGVCTWTLYQPKSALQDASRGLGKDTSFGSTLMMEVTKLKDLEDTKDLVQYFEDLKQSPKLTPTLSQWINDNIETIHWANKMLGLCKNVGTHAGGIVVTPGPIYDYIPVVRGGKEILTAFREADGSAKDLSELGILKLDILGLKTLNVLKESIEGVKRDFNIDISDNVKYVDLEDKKLYKKFNQGNNIGIFQFDGDTVNGLIKSINPDSFEDLVAINAINRPGPLESFGRVFGEWKRIDKSRDAAKIEELDKERYPFDFMKESLKRTYGCLLYQEQFMLMVKAAAGFNMGEADSFRRAIAWKEDHPKYHTVKKYFDRLKEGMTEKGYSESDVEKFLDYCRNFMGYSFNLSHALSYAYLAMQTLYIKVYYPVYFYTALLNVSPQEEYQSIIADAIANGIDILPPSINKSEYNFIVEDGDIRIGFKALKGFGDKAMEELINFDLKQYHDVYDILQLPFKKVNKAAFQCLVDAGAFDEFGVEREKIEVVKELFNEDKIEKWFTRASKALEIGTMPEILFQFPENILFSILEKLKPEIEEINRVKEENKLIKKQAKKDGIEPVLTEINAEPWKRLIIDLIPYIKIKPLTDKQKEDRAEEVLGFSMELVRKLSQLLLLANKYPELNLKSITARTSERDLCYWFLINKTTAQTKNGKSYLNLTVTDNHITVKMKCWEVLPLEKGKAYVSHINKNDFGYSLKNDGFLSEITL